MSDLSNRIIRVFLDKSAVSLRDAEIRSSLAAQGLQCSNQDIHRLVEQLSPALFRLVKEKDYAVIYVEPKLEICEPFLAAKCHLTQKPCHRLHICRDFGHCTVANCRFPHDFTRGTNRTIVERMNCQQVDSELLFKLIRLKNPRQKRFIPKPRQRPPSSVGSQQPVLITDNIIKQVDISFPSSKRVPDIDFEVIEMRLKLNRFNIEKFFPEDENEYYRRVTIQLEQANEVEKLITSPIPDLYKQGVRFKRTKQSIDRTSFLLKLTIGHNQTKANENKINLYVDFLIGDNKRSQLFDLSHANDQAFLVVHEDSIEFDEVFQKLKSRPTLDNKSTSILRVYECDSITLSFCDQNNLMKYELVYNMAQAFRDELFTFQVIENNQAEIEFVNADAFRKSIPIISKVQAQWRVAIKPIAIPIENENNETPNVVPTQVTPSAVPKPRSLTISLRSDWAMIVAHPLFQSEYKDFIRDQLNCDVEINGNQVTCTANVARISQFPNEESTLVNSTNNYMQRLRFSKLYNLKPHQLDILRSHSNVVAFNRIQQNTYSAAAKSKDLFALRKALFPQRNQPDMVDPDAVQNQPPFEKN